MNTVATRSTPGLGPDFDPWDPRGLPDPYAVYGYESMSLLLDSVQKAAASRDSMLPNGF